MILALKTNLLKTLLLFPIFLLFTGWVSGADTFSIKLNSNSPVQYCSDPVLVAQYVTIEASFQITGMTISFSQGFISGEDELTYSKPTGSNITGTWSQSLGNMSLQGDANSTAADYQAAIRLVKYKNNKTIPNLTPRKISITLMNADFLPYTQHFYKYIASDGISWSAAKSAASASNYFGLKGYLATITSSVENTFIQLKTKGVGWIGASDQAVEGDWRWVTGPEGLLDSGQGLLFWKGLRSQYNSGVSGTGPVQGQYNNWNAGEPNDCCDDNIPHQEDYAHILFFPNDPAQSLKWNDLPNGGGTGDYYPRGYLVEFGDKPDTLINLSATLDLQVNTILFKTGTISAICSGDTVTLNQPDNGAIHATYSWTPASTLSLSTIANPLAKPIVSTTYTVVGTRGICTATWDFIVPVNQKPKVTFNIDTQKCYGYSLDVIYTGDANSTGSKFTWIFGKDTIANAIGRTSVTIPLGMIQPTPDLTLYVHDQNKCSDHSTVSNILVIPKLNPWTVKDSILCLTDTFKFAVKNPDPLLNYDWNFGDQQLGTGPDVIHRYQQPGKYDIQLTVTNPANKCSNTAVLKEMVQAAQLPVASFTVSDSIVYKDRPKVDFTNTSKGTGTLHYVWNFGDDTATVVDDPNPSHSYTVTGRHPVLLAVTNEFGCKDSVVHKILVAFDRLFPPTAFSPNAPNPDDRTFLLYTEGIHYEGYHFWVLSRWDDVIFEVQHEIKGWDGRLLNGLFAPPGVYNWRLIYTDFLGKWHWQSGTVTLIF